VPQHLPQPEGCVIRQIADTAAYGFQSQIGTRALPGVIENLYLVELLDSPAQVLHARVMYAPDFIGRSRMPAAIRSNRHAADIELNIIECNIEWTGQESVSARRISLPEGDVRAQSCLVSEASSTVNVLRDEPFEQPSNLGSYFSADVLVGSAVQFSRFVIGVEEVKAGSETGKRLDLPLPGGPATTIIRGACISSLAACQEASLS
jgi:hypothetical protein